MKKKVLSACAVSALAATMLIGGSLAYFTDQKAADNNFVLGNVKIALNETFEQNSVLIPGKDIAKKVTVTNTGDSDAYVRVHVAIPNKFDDGNPKFEATNNFIHFNFDNESVKNNQWCWTEEYREGYGWDTKSWNYYETEIEGEAYNVYVITYRTALKSGQTTSEAINNVYMDASVDCIYNEYTHEFTFIDKNNKEVTLHEDNLKTQIKVVAEAVQTEGFKYDKVTNAYEAFDVAYGKQTSENNPWTGKTPMPIE